MNRKEGHDDLARLDFEVAAKLGSHFAKMQLVELNPYAALCNQMLHDVMGKLQLQKWEVGHGDKEAVSKYCAYRLNNTWESCTLLWIKMCDFWVQYIYLKAHKPNTFPF